MKWREKKKNIKRNERNPAKKKGTMQLKNWKKLQYYKIPTNKIKTFGFMVFHSFVWFVVLLFRFFFHSFFQTSSCDWFIYKIRMLFVCVCTFLVIYLKHLNEYIYWKYTFSLVLHIKAIYCISIQIFIGFFVVFVVVVACHFWFEAKLIFQHLFHFMRWVVLNKLVLIWEFSYRS